MFQYYLKILLSALLIIGMNKGYAQESLIDWVNPLIGTKNIWILHGRTTPFVTPPFGMTHWTPMTRNSGINELLYYYRDDYIIGFRGSHKPAKWMGDYGHVSLMPGMGEVKTIQEDRKLKFRHKDEISTPYYYSVDLKTKHGEIKTEMTATEHCGIFRFTYLEGEDPYLLIETRTITNYYSGINLDSCYIQLNLEKGEIVGYNEDRNSAGTGPDLPNFKGYFVIKLDQSIEDFGTWDQNFQFPNQADLKGQYIGAYLRMKPSTKTVTLKVGTSFISIDQARENLEKEIPEFDFEKVKEQTKQIWESYLNRVQMEGGSKNERSIFYTAMYHSLLFPRKFSEYGKYYSAFDDTIHNGESYNDFSLWDTFRGEHPWLTIIAPDHVNGMVRALLQMYQEGGYMPKWPNPGYTNIMIGTHADAVVADAIVKGFKGFDYDTAYAAVWKDAMVPPYQDSINSWWNDRMSTKHYEARGGLYWYKKLGYVPADKTAESVSRTLEFAYDDFCVAQVAKAVGKMEEYEYFMHRSKNYRNLYNSETGFMAPKNVDGTWHENPKAGFTEGSPWTYLFCVMQDVPGMIELMGGHEQFIKKLDKSFKGILRYMHENEPGHHYTYLYDYVGEPWKTQKLVAKNRRTKYHNKPFGLNGDDDCGQMSAWYILSSLGFYSVTPGTNVYAIGTPLFPEAIIHPDPEKPEITFTIIAKNVSWRNKYIQSAALNGAKLEKPFLKHTDITKGGELIFEMGSRPNKTIFKFE